MYILIFNFDGIEIGWFNYKIYIKSTIMIYYLIISIRMRNNLYNYMYMYYTVSSRIKYVIYIYNKINFLFII